MTVRRIRRTKKRVKRARSASGKERVPAILLVVTARPAKWEDVIHSFRARSPVDVEIVATGEAARRELVLPNVLMVAIDSQLPDMSGYDLCAWVRARFRDMGVVLLGHLDLDTSAVDLNDDGTEWTVPEALRQRMTDFSVLDVTPESIPMLPDAYIADTLGIDLAQLAENKEEILRRTGFGSMPELIHHVRNLPRGFGQDAPSARGRKEPQSTGHAPTILAVTDRVERWRADLETFQAKSGRQIICVPNSDLAKQALAFDEMAGVLADTELPDMSGYDFVGFLRVHFRHLPIRMLGDDDVATSAVPTGSGWTVHDSLLAKMSDLSVLVVTPESIPMVPEDVEAEFLGITVDELRLLQADQIVGSTFNTYAEFVHHLRNRPPPED